MDTRTAIREFIAKELLSAHDAPYPDDDDKLIEIGLIDSIGMLRLVSFLESNCGVSVSGEDFTESNFSSIRTILAYVERKRSAS